MNSVGLTCNLIQALFLLEANAQAMKKLFAIQNQAGGPEMNEQLIRDNPEYLTVSRWLSS